MTARDNQLSANAGATNHVDGLASMVYEADERVARITLNRPAKGNSLTMETARELARYVERANLDPAIHVIALSGNGPGFCAGYDLKQAANAMTAHHADPSADEGTRAGSPVDLDVIAANHDPAVAWDPITDFQMMWRNVRGFSSLFESEKPVVCKVHGFCIGGGADMALGADLVVIEDDAKIGHPPARMWGAPTSGLWTSRLGVTRAKRLLLTGDCLSGLEAVEWGLAIESAPSERLDERFENLVQRIALVPINQLVMNKMLINQQLYAQGIHSTQVLGTLFDGIARHTREGYDFAARVQADGWREAVRARDEPFGDFGHPPLEGGQLT